MATIIQRVYNGFRGVDFRSNEPILSRSPDAVNMWKDYGTIDSIRTRPGIVNIPIYDENGNEILEETENIIFFKGKIVFTGVERAGETTMLKYGNIYCGEYDNENNCFNCYSCYNYYTSIFDAVDILRGENKSRIFFVFNNRLYFKHANYYVVLNEHYKEDDDAEGKWRFEDVEPYVPTTSIGRKPSGGGTMYEDVNILTNVRKNSFVGDGKSKTYSLDVPYLTMQSDLLSVEINGEEIAPDDYTVDIDSGEVTFKTAPPEPLTDGQDNVVIKFEGDKEGTGKENKWRSVKVFDNRVFVSLYSQFKNQIIHSSLNDPTYFSDLDYYEEGDTTARITGIVAGNNALWVFKEPNDNNTTIFYHTPAIDDDYGKIYPSAHSSIATGCIGGAVNFNDDIVFLSPNGLEGISGSITSEQVLSHRSSLVDRKLVADLNGNSQVFTAEWKNYLMIFVNGHIYLADNKSKWQNDDHWEYEWFYWDISDDMADIYDVYVHDDVVYLATDGGIYMMSDDEGNITSYWTTPIDRFNASNSNNDNMLKTTNKRGFVVEATGNIDLSAKTEKDNGFKTIGKYTNVTDYFAPRLKEKKFKDLQLKFSSDTRFSLESAKIEAIVGGYIKR